LALGFRIYEAFVGMLSFNPSRTWQNKTSYLHLTDEELRLKEVSYPVSEFQMECRISF
jgi:hypothetical protein